MHLLDAAINLLPKGFLCNLGNQYIVGNCFISAGIEIFHLVKACKCSAITILIHINVSARIDNAEF